MAILTPTGEIEGDGPALVSREALLAKAIRKLCLPPGSTMGVACCDGHLEDRAVAHGAAVRLGFSSERLPCDAETFAHAHRRVAPALVMACPEGTSAWCDAGVGGRILGDGPGVPWWRSAELRAAAPSPARTDDRR